LSTLTIPWYTYSDPEIAHVGMYEKDARDRGIAVDAPMVRFTEVDRALADGGDDGVLKTHVRKGTDKILGATIAARHAGKMISEITPAIVGRLGLRTIANVIHPYPTQAEAVKKAANACNRRRLRPFTRRLLRGIMALRR